MSDEIKQYFSRLLATLRVVEAKQKKRYDNAFDIEDIAEATAVTIDARTKIQMLRKSIEELQSIYSEYSRLFNDGQITVSQRDDSEFIASPDRIVDSENLQTESETDNLEIADDEQYSEFTEFEIEHTLLNESSKPDENDDYVIADPDKFTLLGKSYSVNGWQEILTKLCEVMVLIKPYKLLGISAIPSLNSLEKQMLSLSKQKIMEPSVKLSNGLYVTMVGSPKEIKMRCEYILKTCGYDNEDLQIC